MSYGQFSYNGGFDNASRFRGDRAEDRASGARVKRVMPTNTVIHTFAQRTQTCGANAKGSVYFEGDTLYSYGSHFILARFVESPHGGLVCFLNADSYSPTTSGHQSAASSATRQYRQFTLPGAGCVKGDWSRRDLSPAEALAWYVSQAGEYAAKAKRGRSEWTRDYNASKAADFMDEARRFAEAFGEPPPSGDLAEMASRVEAERARVKAAEAARAEAARAEAAADFAGWQAGERRYVPAAWRQDAKGSAFCRVIGEEVETSQGATVPLRAALRVYRFAKLCREKRAPFKADQKGWGRNAPAVGSYTLDAVDARGNVNIGCHFISFARLDECAKLAGYGAEPAAPLRAEAAAA